MDIHVGFKLALRFEDGRLNRFHSCNAFPHKYSLTRGHKVYWQELFICKTMANFYLCINNNPVNKLPVDFGEFFFNWRMFKIQLHNSSILKIRFNRANLSDSIAIIPSQ